MWKYKITTGKILWRRYWNVLWKHSNITLTYTKFQLPFRYFPFYKIEHSNICPNSQSVSVSHIHDKSFIQQLFIQLWKQNMKWSPCPSVGFTWKGKYFQRNSVANTARSDRTAVISITQTFKLYLSWLIDYFPIHIPGISAWFCSGILKF